MRMSASFTETSGIWHGLKDATLLQMLSAAQVQSVQSPSSAGRHWDESYFREFGNDDVLCSSSICRARRCEERNGGLSHSTLELTLTFDTSFVWKQTRLGRLRTLFLRRDMRPKGEPVQETGPGPGGSGVAQHAGRPFAWAPAAGRWMGPPMQHEQGRTFFTAFHMDSQEYRLGKQGYSTHLQTGPKPCLTIQTEALAVVWGLSVQAMLFTCAPPSQTSPFLWPSWRACTNRTATAAAGRTCDGSTGKRCLYDNQS
jgi:hypothetical protein